MKKLITILAILTVLVGAIFATNPTESHEIHITVTINAELPAFQLKFNGANSNSTAVKFTDEAEREDSTAVAATIDFESNTASARTVTVDAYLANTAKQSAQYKLTFSDGVFKDGNSQTVVSPTSITAAAGSGTGYGAANGVSTTVSGAVATVTFGGTVRCTADTLIAQAAYLYPKADIAPGTYTADIVMTVEAL